MLRRLEWYKQVTVHKWRVGWPMVKLVLRYVAGDEAALSLVPRRGDLNPIYICLEILRRAIVHDLSKYSESEARWFIQTIREMDTARFGTPEYKRCCEIIKPGIERHYSRNSHHPQFYENGVAGMSELDRLEMFFDWEAASRRNGQGNSYSSVELCAEKFGLSEPDKRWAHAIARFVDRERWERCRLQATSER